MGHGPVLGSINKVQSATTPDIDPKEFAGFSYLLGDPGARDRRGGVRGRVQHRPCWRLMDPMIGAGRDSFTSAASLFENPGDILMPPAGSMRLPSWKLFQPGSTPSLSRRRTTSRWPERTAKCMGCV